MRLKKIVITLIIYSLFFVAALNADQAGEEPAALTTDKNPSNASAEKIKPVPPADEDQGISSNRHWHQLDTGLELGIFLAPLRSEVGDSRIRILRIDPQHFELKLMNTSATENGHLLSAKEWCRRNGLVAAINASMFQTDYRTSVSLMRTRSHINNRRLSKDMTILAFDRKSPEVPLVKIIDRQCDDFEALRKQYGTLVQSIRMISCTGRNVWSAQPQKWSTAAIGMDKRGRILFIHVRSPYSTHDLINMLKKLPLDIERAMYCEGGPQAQLYIRSNGREHEFVGGYSTGNNDAIENPFSWSIPNVVGIALRKPVKGKQ